MDDAFGAGELAPTNVYVSAANLDASLVDVDRVTQAIADIPGVTRVSGPTRPTGDPPAVDPAVLQAAIPRLPAALREGPAAGAAAASAPANVDPRAQAVLEAFFAGRRFISPDGTTARLDVVFEDDPYGIPAIERIADIRTAVRAAAAGTSLDPEVLVGGPTALQADAWSAVNRDVSVVGPIVVALIWFILLLLLRSLVAATYLVASVLLSFLAALGLSVVIFQNILGHPGVGYQNAVWMFIFLAALGADYNILIMTRVREEIRARGLVEGTRIAVARTGGVITSAGADPRRDVLDPDHAALARYLPTWVRRNARRAHGHLHRARAAGAERGAALAALELVARAGADREAPGRRHRRGYARVLRALIGIERDTVMHGGAWLIPALAVRLCPPVSRISAGRGVNQALPAADALTAEVCARRPAPVMAKTRCGFPRRINPGHHEPGPAPPVTCASRSPHQVGWASGE